MTSSVVFVLWTCFSYSKWINSKGATLLCSGQGHGVQADRSGFCFLAVWQGSWALSAQTRDQSRACCIGGVQSHPLDHQGSPRLGLMPVSSLMALGSLSFQDLHLFFRKIRFKNNYLSPWTWASLRALVGYSPWGCKVGHSRANEHITALHWEDTQGALSPISNTWRIFHVINNHLINVFIIIF